ncbi:MAG: DUF805 domain-containing protein [Cohaesibacter sp.]|nr:DUF805 domain-containing protein [Cohaesibacter sp.]MCV6603067.1 DUF805 domain-containing protein [Cohaesibacter sp.]
MTFEHMLFDSSGTLSRKEFWLAHVILFPMEMTCAALFRVQDNYLCTLNPTTAMGQLYYASLGLLTLVFCFMWYCVVIKRLRAKGRGHLSFFAYAVPILATLSVLAPHFPFECSVSLADRALYLSALVPFWLIYFIDLGIWTKSKAQPA